MLGGFSRREAGILTLIYFSAHWFLLVTTGWWYDDFAHLISYSSYWDMVSELGRPDIIYLYYLVNKTPQFIPHIVTFLLFYVNIFFLNIILKNWQELNTKARFYICALYIILPIFDVRISTTIMPYSIGLFLFMAACAQLSILLKKEEVSYWERTINLIIFFLSFTTNSNLIFFGIALLMIYNKEKQAKVKKYWSYLLLPFVYYLSTRCFFPAHGIYENYNQIKLLALIKSLIYIILADIKVLFSVLNNLITMKTDKVIICLWLMIVVFIVKNTKENKVEDDYFDDYNACVQKTITLGLIILSLGLFSYVTIRGTADIQTNYFGGRDSVLAGFGCSLLLYGLIRKIFGNKLYPYVFGIGIICGIIYFNNIYMEYTQVHYGRVGLERKLAQNKEIGLRNNIIYYEKNPLKEGHNINFYGLGYIFSTVYGNTNRIIVPGISGLVTMPWNEIDDYICRESYHIMGYNKLNNDIDAVIYFSFDELSSKDVLLFKWYELMDSEKFYAGIEARSHMFIDYDVNSDLIEDISKDW